MDWRRTLRIVATILCGVALVLLLIGTPGPQMLLLVGALFCFLLSGC